MDTFEHDVALFSSNKGDDSLYVQFYMHVLQNPEKSAKEGRPIFDDTEFVKIFSPGDRTNIIDRPVRPSDKVRFPKQYAIFKENKDANQDSGTPLSEWPIVTRSLAEELKYLGFTTVEHVAEARDDVLGKVMGLRDLNAKAKAYLEVAKGSTAPIEKMTEQVKELQAQVRMRDEALETLKSRLDSIEKSQAAQQVAKKT